MFHLCVKAHRALIRKGNRTEGTGERLRLVNAVHVCAVRVPGAELLGTGGAGVLPVQVLLLHVVPQVRLRGIDVGADAATPEVAAAPIIAPSLRHVRQQRVHLCDAREGKKMKDYRVNKTILGSEAFP